MKKNNRLPDYSSNDYFFDKLVNNFSAFLLYEKNVLNIFDADDIFRFLFMAKYWNSDQIKLLVWNIRATHP